MPSLAEKYAKWDKIELSDDEEDVHPNIDRESWFRMKHRSRVEREEHEGQPQHSLVHTPSIPTPTWTIDIKSDKQTIKLSNYQTQSPATVARYIVFQENQKEDVSISTIRNSSVIINTTGLDARRHDNKILRRRRRTATATDGMGVFLRCSDGSICSILLRSSTGDDWPCRRTCCEVTGRRVRFVLVALHDVSNGEKYL
mmetsp:Transcript_29105/g.70184  ORF Transcript_29105/g.70184 Transcript_29105/m.70184 type:complete len:199 (+) Transcript_29105:176-772(+)